jgi:Uncharacterized conserved protein (DUF2190)
MAGPRVIHKLVDNYDAEVQIKKHRFVALGTSDGGITLALGATAPIIGVSTDIDAEIGQPCDVVRAGLAKVVYGAAVAKGALLTSDAQGRAITAAAGNYYAGIAEIAGVADDIGSYQLEPGKL